MKTYSSIVVLMMLAAMPNMASAEVMDLTTTTGRVYRNCRIVNIEHDGVSFRHANGAGKVLFKDLTKDLRDHFDYDPVKAQAHEEKLKADKAKARAESLKAAAELMKSHQEAVNRVLEGQALVAMARQAQSGYGGGIVSAFSESYAPLGPVYDGGDYYRDGRGYGYGNGRYRSPLLNAWSDWCGGGYLNACRITNFGASYQLAGNYNGTGYRSAPFFAVPGVGPNVAPGANSGSVWMGVGKDVAPRWVVPHNGGHGGGGWNGGGGHGGGGHGGGGGGGHGGGGGGGRH